MNKQNQIIIRNTSNFPNLFIHAGKFLEFANDSFKVNENGIFALEQIENGFIYIYKDYNAFLHFNQKFEKQDIDMIKNENKFYVKSATLLGETLTKNNFPRQGIDFYYDIFTDLDKKQEIINHLYNRYSLKHFKQVKKKDNPNHDLTINFGTYEDIIALLDQIILKFSGQMNKAHKI